MKSDDEQGRDGYVFPSVEWATRFATPWMRETVSSIYQNSNLREKFHKINKFDWELEDRMIRISNRFEQVLNKLIYSILGQTFIDIVEEQCKKFKDFIEQEGFNFNGYLVNAMRLVVINAMPRTLRRILQNKQIVTDIFGDKAYVSRWRVNLVSEQLFASAN